MIITHSSFYFEAASVIIALILLGRMTEARAKGRTGEDERRYSLIFFGLSAPVRVDPRLIILSLFTQFGIKYCSVAIGTPNSGK